ncbi:VOC family protein [Streptococcus uberis]|nr:VOC family protein [Streptococcus uberis]
MEFKSLMHIAFYTNQLDQMLDFYVNKLGMTKKSEVKYSIYLDWDDRPALQKIAREEPDRIFNS